MASQSVIDVLEAQLGGYALPAADGEPVRTWLDLVRDVARNVGVDYRDILSDKRSRSIVRARHSVWAELCERGYSMNEIALRWGANSTTVSAAMRKLCEHQEAA